MLCFHRRDLAWLLALAGATAAAGAWGHHEGARLAGAQYEAQKEHAAEISAERTTAQLAHTADASLAILTVARDYLAELNLSTLRRQQIVARVTARARAAQEKGQR